MTTGKTAYMSAGKETISCQKIIAQEPVPTSPSHDRKKAT